MKTTEIEVGTTYANAEGDQRLVTGFTDSRHRKGADDGVTYTVVQGNGAGNSYAMSRAAFARWALLPVRPAEDAVAPPTDGQADGATEG